jgi:hypothetical protein
MRKWFARLFALIALGAAAFGIYYAIDSVRSEDHKVSAADAKDAADQISVANGDLSAKLTALRPHHSPQLARESVHTAAALARKLDEDLGDSGALADAIHSVIRRELAFLDAVGSTLANPRSPLRGRVAEYALDVRRAFHHVPGAGSASIHGVPELVAFSEARLE